MHERLNSSLSASEYPFTCLTITFRIFVFRDGKSDISFALNVLLFLPIFEVYRFSEIPHPTFHQMLATLNFFYQHADITIRISNYDAVYCSRITILDYCIDCVAMVALDSIKLAGPLKFFLQHCVCQEVLLEHNTDSVFVYMQNQAL